MVAELDVHSLTVVNIDSSERHTSERAARCAKTD